MSRFADRRERLLAFVQPWSEACAEYRGSFGHGALELRFITDEGLELIAGRIVRDWRRRRARQICLGGRAA